jgi:hypothetical protein
MDRLSRVFRPSRSESYEVTPQKPRRIVSFEMDAVPATNTTSPQPEQTESVVDDEEVVKGLTDPAIVDDSCCVRLCSPSRDIDPPPDTSLLLVGHETLSNIQKAGAVYEFMWMLIMIALCHNKGTVSTQTCNSDGFVLDGSPAYECIPRGTFSIPVAVIGEPVISTMCCVLMVVLRVTSARLLLNNYIHVRVQAVISFTVLFCTVNTLAGLVAQSTYVYTALTVSMIALSPAMRPQAIPVSVCFSILAFVCVTVPVISISLAPEPGQYLPATLKATIAVTVTSSFFFAVWWLVAMWFNVSYGKEMWIYIAMVFLCRSIVRVCVLLVLL